MHGAGWINALFLRSTSALIELIVSYLSTGEHFAIIASWRRFIYLYWNDIELTVESLHGRTTDQDEIWHRKQEGRE